jgi:hypothetical protein
MQEVRTAIVARLTSDSPTLYPSLVPGGIYDRPLKAGQGQGATPDAFWIMPGDAARIVRLRESIVVLGPNETMPVDGFVDTEDLAGVTGFLRIFYYVPATAAGKTALDAIDARVRQRLHGWQTQLSVGYPLTVSVLRDLTEPLDSDEFPGNLVCQRRIVGEYLRAAA